MLKFVEIEHKYLVPKDFDLTSWRQQALLLGPLKQTNLVVTDTYYRLTKLPDIVLRHRHDSELQQLTLKSVGLDNESRTEIDLQLDQQVGNQVAAVNAFVTALGPSKSATLQKKIEVYHYATCEMVHYIATSPEAGAREICCVEFEAKHVHTTEEAIETITAYAKQFGFNPAQRETTSLAALMFPQLINTNG